LENFRLERDVREEGYKMDFGLNLGLYRAIHSAGRARWKKIKRNARSGAAEERIKSQIHAF